MAYKGKGSTFYGTYANRPIQGQAGRKYIANNSNKLYYDNGTAWIAIGEVFNTKEIPSLTNSGFVSVTTFGTSAYCLAADKGGTNTLAKAYASLTPAKDIIACFKMFGGGSNDGTVYYFGIGAGDGTKYTAFTMSSGGNWNVRNWSNSTTIASTLLTTAGDDVCQNVMWVKTSVDASSNLTHYFSKDGINWIQVYNHSSYTTVTQGAFICHQNDGTPAATLYSFEIV